jgi:fumarate hydratase class I
MEFLANSLLELITQTSTNLPPDVRAAMSIAANQETPGTQSSQALDIILSNVDMAVEDEGPICQDTGMPTFVVHTPVGVNQIRIKSAIQLAVAEATRLGKLRPNSVDSLTGKNSGDNLGTETPVVHFEQWERDEIEVKRSRAAAARTETVIFGTLQSRSPGPRRPESGRRPKVHSACCLAGTGAGLCAGALGVCIGSDRAPGDLARGQLFRPGRCELSTGEAGSGNYGGGEPAGVGAMGGGKASLIGCKIIAANRLPPAFS